MTNNSASEQAPEIQLDEPPAKYSRDDTPDFRDFLKEIRSHLHEYLTFMAPLISSQDEESAISTEATLDPTTSGSCEETRMVLQKDLDRLEEILNWSIERHRNVFPFLAVVCIL